MRTGIISISGALLGVGLIFSSIPAGAQGVEVQVPGVGVRIGDPDRPRYREREHDRERVYIERRENTGSCRTVTESVERPDGSTATRSVRRCD